jgi:hypothetical protein
VSVFTCSEFDEQLEELAVGDLDESARRIALDHAAACRRCRQRLDDLLGITAAMLEFAPHREPPAGFENRVLDRLDGQRAVSHRRVIGRWLAVAAAVAALIVSVGAGFAAGRRQDATSEASARSGAIETADGSTVGSIRLVRAAQPYALVTIDHAQPQSAVVRCELVFGDGSVETIGTWGYGDIRNRVWAVGIDDHMVSATSMRLVDESGALLATAQLA